MTKLKTQAENFINELNSLDNDNMSLEDYNLAELQLYEKYGLNTPIKNPRDLKPFMPNDYESVLQRLKLIRSQNNAEENRMNFINGINPAIQEAFKTIGNVANNGFLTGNEAYEAEANKIRQKNLLLNELNYKPWYIQNDGNNHPVGTMSVEKGGSLTKQNLFDLMLGKFTRNQLEGPGYMNLESRNQNLKDAKSISTKLLGKLPKESLDKLMKLFISYADLPNFKNNYLNLFV